MAEKPMSGKYHSYTILICHIDRFLVAYRTTGLNDSRDSCFPCCFNCIPKREERVRRHDGAFTLFSRFGNGNIRRTYAIHLSRAHAVSDILTGQHDGVGLNVLYNLPAEFQCLPLFFRRRSFRDTSTVCSRFGAVVRCLHEKSAGNLMELQFFFFRIRHFYKADVFLHR